MGISAYNLGFIIFDLALDTGLLSYSIARKLLMLKSYARTNIIG